MTARRRGSPRRGGRRGGGKLGLGGWIVLLLIVGVFLFIRMRMELPDEEPDVGGEPTVSGYEGMLPDDGGKGYEIVEHPGYVLGYCEEWEQAAWVVESLEDWMLAKKSKRTDDFRADPSVSTGSARPQDYVRSGYDKGHLAPAGDFGYDPARVSESFYMSNMSPQVPGLNRGVWKDVEEWVRGAAKREGKLIVVTGPIAGKSKKRIGKSGVLVPDAYFKAVYDTTPPEKMIAFVCWNAEGESRNVGSYVSSVDDVERLTGLDLFPGLEDEKENALEAQAEFSAW